MANQPYHVEGYDRETGEKVSRRIMAETSDEAVKSSGIVVESVNEVRPAEEADSITDPHKRDDRNISINLSFGNKGKKQKKATKPPIQQGSHKKARSTLNNKQVVAISLVVAIACTFIGVMLGIAMAEGNSSSRVTPNSARYNWLSEPSASVEPDDSKAQLPAISMGTGSEASEIRKYLGTPDKVVRVKDFRYPALNQTIPCWIYGNVEIYLSGDRGYSKIIHWEGDLKGLIDRKARD